MSGLPISPLHRALSVAIIVRDDAEGLKATLESVRAIADEIVVVDTGSTDKTLDVVARYGARQIVRPWSDDFSAPRNAAYDACRGTWVLWLDAGETLDAASAPDLRRALDTIVDLTKAYVLMVSVPAAPASQYAEQVGRIRLVPKMRGLTFTGRVRESMRRSIIDQGLAIEIAPWRIHRPARDHQAELKKLKAQRDVRLVELEIREQGEQPRLLLALGDALVNLGQTKQAAGCYRAAVERSERGSTEMLEGYYGLLAESCAAHQTLDARIATCLTALEVFPFDAQLLCVMGGFLQAQGHQDLAARSYRTAVDYGQINPETWHVAEVAQVATICLSLLLQMKGDVAAARNVLEGHLQRHGRVQRIQMRLIDILVRLGDGQRALAVVDELPADMPQREAFRSAVRGAIEAHRQNWISAAAYLETAYQGGCRGPMCLRWLSVSRLANGDLHAAQPILEEWLALEPQNPEIPQYLAALEPILRHGAVGSDTATATRTAVAPAADGAAWQVGEFQVNAGLPASAGAIPSQAAAATPPASAAATLQARCEELLLADRTDEAVELTARSASKVELSRGFAEFMAAVVLSSRGFWQPALDQLAAARRSGYAHPLVAYQAAYCLSTLGRHAEAESMLRHEMARSGDSRDTQERLARLKPAAPAPVATPTAAKPAAKQPPRPHMISPAKIEPFRLPTRPQ
ncbi:MAG: glycosyltransferase [Pirellulales bacterium]|nr:glycosyltransferase [Pirellulales bacterium]